MKNRPTKKKTRAGNVSVAWLAFLASVGLLAVFIALLMWNPDGTTAPSKQPLVVYCAAGIKAPVEAAARAYEAAYGVPVQLQYGPSQTLLANIELSRQGDLYLPADDSYIDIARKKDLLDESIPLAKMTPRLAVPKGNPKKLRSIDDLLREGVRVVQANPDAAAIGKVTRDALQKTGQWEKLKQRTLVFKSTVSDVANDVKVGTVDAGIVWDALAGQYPDLELIPLPEFDKVVATVAIAVIRTTAQPAAALRFARYLAATEKGSQEFAKHGFQTVAGDEWSESPELRLFAGAMLRPAIEETITAFENREGVRVTRVYNGCGILVAQMLAGEKPDAYFACDKSFMDQVHDLFLDATDVSTNQLVILVPHGNPKAVKSLDDLGQPGLRLGIGHEKQCALGVLTQQTLVQGGAHGRVMKNVAVQSPTGDMLVNQLRTGSLDAVIAYVSNATAAADELDAIRIDGIPCAIAVQPMAVSRGTKQSQLATRLMAALKSRASQERFEASGFHWQEARP